MNTPRTSSNSVGPKGLILYTTALLGLATILEPKNSLDPTGQSGFRLRGTGTTALVDREAAKQEVIVKDNFGQGAGL